LLKLRETTKDFIKYNVGDEKSFHLWMDWWYPDGVLYDKYHFKVVYDAGIKVNAKLDSVVKDGDWFWPSARSEELVVIQSKLEPVERSVEDNQYMWVLSKRRIDPTTETWELSSSYKALNYYIEAKTAFVFLFIVLAEIWREK